jgi:hypothetical protein
LTPKELELLHGMVNCYHVCHANFEETVEMVGSARGLSPEKVKEILGQLRQNGGEEYLELRRELPAEFPM